MYRLSIFSGIAVRHRKAGIAKGLAAVMREIAWGVSGPSKWLASAADTVQPASTTVAVSQAQRERHVFNFGHEPEA